MSADDPTDDELEREAARDVPLAMGGSRGHAPKLSQESRAINPKQLLADEARAQGGELEDRMMNAPDLAEYMERQRRMGERTQTRQGPPPVRREPPRSGASPLARSREIQTEPPPAKHEPAPTLFHPDAVAWDRYVSACLIVANANGAADPMVLATEMADWLLAKRRERFG